MTTGNRRPCHWIARGASFLGLATVTAWAWGQDWEGGTAAVQSNALVQYAAPQDITLYLEVVLNQVPLHKIEPFHWRANQLFAAPQTLRELGLSLSQTEGAALLALDDIPGLHYVYDEADQRLTLEAPVALLTGPMAQFGYELPPTPKLDPATQAPGLLLNYDLYGQRSTQSRSISGWNELRLFGVGSGVWRSSSLLLFADSQRGNSNQRNIRLDTAWQMDFPDSMVTVTLGDAYSSALSWTRSMHFGGLRISRNFALQPYRVTVPLQSFVGETAVPSVVDLYINGIREAQNRVNPGRFQVLGAPVLNGAGSAQMVITDITGQSRVVNFSLYNSAKLLQQGLSDWSVEVGTPRRNYGLDSFAYAAYTMVSASGRYGLSNRLTLESHAESADGLRMAGLGGLLLLGQTGGVVRASYAASRHDAQRGQQRSLGYEWQGAGVNLSVATQARSVAFSDVASLEKASLPRRTHQAFVGLNIAHGQVGVSYVQQDYWASPNARYAGLSWSQNMGRYGNLHAGINRDLQGGGGTTAYLYWSLPLERHRQLWVSTRHQGQGSQAAAVGAMQSLPGDRDGWGWRVEAGAGEQAGGRAEVSQLTRYGQWRAGLEQQWGERTGITTYIGASGGLLWMQGHVFPMRRAHDAFALVSTDGVANVPVKLENRLVGSTDEDGHLLVTPLIAWENNNLSIDPLELPEDVRIDRVQMMAVPATGSGTLARFPMSPVVVVELAVRDAHGAWVPAGTRVQLGAGEQSAVVGYDGRVYLQNPPAGARLSLELPAGLCQVQLPQNWPERGRVDVGILSCQ